MDFYMDEATGARIQRDVLLYMPHVALVEIRAAESLNAAKKISDIFHNLPMGLFRRPTREDFDVLLDELLERAQRWGMDDYIRNLNALALQSVGKAPRGGEEFTGERSGF
ncbi:hypothetical protein FE772_17040 [Lysobacter enzymogenes]|nr:hypothetical protein [Lysobacter enzymogenes]QCW27086.1 hypothetical protein FE772_17040 [Lysobacter enzymogenes]